MTNEEAIQKLNELFPYVQEYQKLAADTCNIQDIFQDNGGKIMQMLLLTGLTNMDDSREGNDAIDNMGMEYELKSVNIKLTNGFSTNHHLNHKILNKYRSVDWVFAVYENIELYEIYVLTPEQLNPFFEKWKEQIDRELAADDKYKGINNPKIPLKFVVDNGVCIYKRTDEKKFYFSDITKRVEVREEKKLNNEMTSFDID